MRRYETIVIIDSDVSEEKRTSMLDKVNTLINQHAGLLIETENWGIKKLAYEIRNKARGYYVRLDFCSEVTLIQEMEYLFKINDSVLKFMTVVLEKEANLEAIKNILAETDQSKKKDKNDTELKNHKEYSKNTDYKTNTVEED